MRECTRAFIQQLRDAPLFTAVGQHDLGPDVLRVSTWAKCARICTLRDNHNVRIDARNDLTEALPRERMNQWNDLVREYQLTALLAQKIDGIAPPGDSPTTVMNVTRWDLNGAAMEIEYSDVVRVSFYQGLLKWYLQGHVVCGWDTMEGYFRPIVF